eukprot:3118027-Prymnesium_polylepis.1
MAACRTRSDRSSEAVSRGACKREFTHGSAAVSARATSWYQPHQTIKSIAQKSIKFRVESTFLGRPSEAES